MKTKVLVTIGLAVLGLASVFLITGRGANSTSPSVQDFGAAGTSAFAELIRRDGYQVRLEREVRPKLPAAALMVLPTIATQPGWAEFLNELNEEAGEPSDEGNDDPETTPEAEGEGE